jgi:hypothetical protein
MRRRQYLAFPHTPLDASAERGVGFQSKECEKMGAADYASQAPDASGARMNAT